MAQKIIWSARAIKDWDAVTDYLLKQFGESSVHTIHSHLLKKLSLIESNPHLYPLTRKRNIRKAVVNKRLIILYHYKPGKGEIEIASLWDTRRNK